jgi:hypothetical protein
MLKRLIYVLRKLKPQLHWLSMITRRVFKILHFLKKKLKWY